MASPRFVAWMLACATLGATPIASAQNYPSKPIRIVTSNPGGSNDFTARILAQGLTGPLGQQVIVDNRGGGSFISAEVVARAPPDGYTLLFTDTSGWTS